MPTSLHSSSAWWNQLGFRYYPPVGTRHERHVTEAVGAVLRNHPPIVFHAGNHANTSPNTGEGLSLDEMKKLLTDTISDAETRTNQQWLQDAKERQRFGWEQVEAAFTASGADELITSGRWTGFTRGEATAWCWNLFQYEPHGFVHPGTQLKAEALSNLMSGGLPEVFGYPERAREHKNRGLTPRTYRQHKEALGENTAELPGLSLAE